METVLQDVVKKGDMFYTSWGYDQTNYDYLGVLSVSATGKTCKCIMVGAKHIGVSGQSNIQEPVFEPYGDVFTMRIKTGYKGDTILKGSYPFCNSGSMENKRLDMFLRVIEGKRFYETDSMFGH